MPREINSCNDANYLLRLLSERLRMQIEEHLLESVRPHIKAIAQKALDDMAPQLKVHADEMRMQLVTQLSIRDPLRITGGSDNGP